MIELRSIFLLAIAGEGEDISLACESNNEANNIRQKLYRYRDKIRATTSDELNLLVDYLEFSVSGKLLLISYKPPETLLEKIQ